MNSGILWPYPLIGIHRVYKMIHPKMKASCLSKDTITLKYTTRRAHGSAPKRSITLKAAFLSTAAGMRISMTGLFWDLTSSVPQTRARMNPTTSEPFTWWSHSVPNTKTEALFGDLGNWMEPEGNKLEGNSLREHRSAQELLVMMDAPCSQSHRKWEKKAWQEVRVWIYGKEQRNQNGLQMVTFLRVVALLLLFLYSTSPALPL